MDGNELAKTEWWKDSLVAVTDTYSGTSLHHQRYYYWWQQHHSISLSSQPWCHFWWTFDYGGACQQCLPIFFFHLHNISSIRRVLDMKTTVIIVQALVISRLDYCNSLLCGLPTILIKKLQRVQNAAARVIAKAGRRDHISPILFKLHWLPVQFRIKYKILLLTYRALHGLAPTYITELLVPYTPPRTLRSSTEQLLVVQKYRLKNFGAGSLETAAPALWNSLESQIRLQKTLTSFRRLLKTHLFRQAFGDLTQ